MSSIFTSANVCTICPVSRAYNTINLSVNVLKEIESRGHQSAILSIARVTSHAVEYPGRDGFNLNVPLKKRFIAQVK